MLRLTQVKFAKLLCIAPAAVQRWEYGTSGPTIFPKRMIEKSLSRHAKINNKIKEDPLYFRQLVDLNDPLSALYKYLTFLYEDE